ncbi:MAG: HEAT repeat domain-containing protein [Bryobacterales bacterium]|nr:HEAT repeat domain-containing protein [Bryobacterales bacterium]
MADIATQIRHAVEALSTNSQNQGRRLRELLDESPAVFQQVVAAMLGSARDTPELRYVIALLSARGMLVPMLRDLSSSDRGAAGVVAQLAQRMDPRFDRSIARQAPEAKTPPDRARPNPEFLLGLLDALSGGLCLLPLLAPLRESEDPKIRARMALLLGRITRAQDWFQTLEQDPDPRVRANVVESLWSVEGASSLACFERSLQDRHHRVVANALVGLYLQGATSGVSGLVRLAQHHESPFRAAATWAMGRTGDTRFLPVLRQMRRGPDQDSMVVRNALHAIARINQATMAATRRETRVICLRRAAGSNSSLDAHFVALDAESGPLPILKPTDWQIRANCQPIWNYQADFVPPSARLAIGVVIPTAPAEDANRLPLCEAALRAAALWRRPQDQFAASLYFESAGSHFQGAALEPLSFGAPPKPQPVQAFKSDPTALLTAAPHSADPIESLKHLASLVDPSAGDSHLILVLDAIPESRCDSAGVASLLTTMRERGIRLHALITGRAVQSLASAFHRLSLDTGGFSLHCPEIEDLASSLQTLIASTFGHYQLRCPLPEPIEQIEVELQAEGHQGKLPLTAENSSQYSRVAA